MTQPVAVAPPPPPAAVVDAFDYLPVPLNRDDDVYPVAQGITYRASVSVAVKYSKSQIHDALASRGWGSITLWDTGEALPSDWPAEDLSSGLEPDHRWLRGEATRTGPSDTLDRVSTLHAIVSLHLSIYRILAMWKKVPHPSSGMIIGAGSGPYGLDAAIPKPIADVVLRTWMDEIDPQKCRDLAQTMREASFPVAANVLEQHAQWLEAAGIQSPEERVVTKSRAGGAAFFAAVLGALATIVSRRR